jgi:hypothetical protein
MTSARFDELFDAILDNGQNWSAAETHNLLTRLLKAVGRENLPTKEARDEFVHRLREHGVLRNYEDVTAILQSDGWAIPAARPRRVEDD